MKTKLTRTGIIPTSQAECWRYLLSGMLLASEDSILEIKEGILWNRTFRCISNETFTRQKDICFEVVKEVELEWHDELPTEKGELPVVLCWVGSVPGFRKEYIQGIYAKSYNENGEIIFESFATNWGYAIPVTQEEFENLNGNYLK